MGMKSYQVRTGFKSAHSRDQFPYTNTFTSVQSVVQPSSSLCIINGCVVKSSRRERERERGGYVMINMSGENLSAH